MFCFASICPHPPIIIPSIGGSRSNEAKKTIEAMEELSARMKNENIDTVLIISPHGTVFMDAMSLNIAENPHGDFLEFSDRTMLSFSSNIDLAIYIKNLADSNSIPVQTVSDKLDHGSLVPLYFLSQDISDLKVIPLSFSFLDYAKHFAFGEIIYEAIQSSEERIAVVASGDLSHRLSEDSFNNFSPQGEVFDKTLIECLEKDDVDSVINMDSELVESAGECGLRSIIILLGILSQSKYKFEKLSYEHPFGVGYMVGQYILE